MQIFFFIDCTNVIICFYIFGYTFAASLLMSGSNNQRAAMSYVLWIRHLFMSLHLALGPGIHAEVHIFCAFPRLLWRRGAKKDWKFLSALSGTDRCDVLLQNCSLVLLPAGDKRTLSPQAWAKRKLFGSLAFCGRLGKSCCCSYDNVRGSVVIFRGHVWTKVAKVLTCSSSANY